MNCGTLKIDLGGAWPATNMEDDRKEYVCLDINDYSGEFAPGKIFQIDLSKGILPFCENSCIKIRACHFLEHLSGSEMINLLDDCHRVLRKDGEMKIQVPNADKSMDAYQPLHKQLMKENALNYLSWLSTKKKWKIINRIIENGDITWIIQPIKE